MSVTVTNTGARPTEDVVQLYFGDRAASVARPVRELPLQAELHLTGAVREIQGHRVLRTPATVN